MLMGWSAGWVSWCRMRTRRRDWAAALKSCVKPQFYEANLKCLEAGLKLASPAA